MSTVNLNLPLRGGCQCGAVRFTLKAAPVVFYLCHCSDCQKQSSSVYGQSVKVRAEDVEIEGELALFHPVADSGVVKWCEFCPKCGTRMIHGRKPGAETFNLKGGTFDDVSWLVPAGHIWVRSKQPFVAIAEGELAYEKAPESYAPLMERWREMIAQA